MDSKLKRQVTFIVTIGVLMVISVAFIANATKISKILHPTEASVSVEVVEKVNEPVADSNGFIKLGNSTSGWKSDETFFDRDEDSLALKIMEEMSSLQVRAVSVENDLRVRVLDYNGNIKTGIPFEVVIRGDGNEVELNLVDDDKDGIIYFEDVKPGRYLISLMPVDEWKVPDQALKVEVKDSVEYLMIEDVDILMMSEASVNTKADNTMVVTAADDADKRMPDKYNENDELVYGIDVSSENGEIDWNQVYQSGIRFVMLRAGYRGSFTGNIITDDFFAENAKNALRAGLDVGAYFYSQAITEAEAVEEASALVLLCSQFTMTYPLCIRVDMAGGMGRADGLDTNERTKVVNAFCQTVKNSGYDPCFYATKNWLNTNLDTRKIDKNKIWLAEFRKIPTYEGYYDMWQYSCKGKVPGIEGEVSLNISYINK